MYYEQLPEPQHELFEAWCDRSGIHRPSVRFGSASASEAGLGLFATGNIAPGEACIIVPVSACISERVARESVIEIEVARENEARMQQRAAAAAAAPTSDAQQNATTPALHRISPRSLFYLYLIHARHSKSSPFSPWLIHGVPRTYDLPLSWSAAERAQLQGTNLGEAVTHRLAQLKAKFLHAVPALRARNPDLFPEHVFNEENWGWAHATYSSRGFPAQLLDPSLRSSKSMLPGAVQLHAENEENGLTMKLDTAAASSSSAAASSAPSSSASASASAPDSSSESLGCLIPYLDLTNHRFRQRVTWTHHAATAASSSTAAASASHPALSCAHVSFASGDALRAGDEIWNNYGAKPNEELLMGYGFTLRDNEADCLTLALGAAAIPQAKQAFIRAAQIQMHQVLSIKNPVPLGLLQLMRACAWDARAVQECSALWLPAVAPELLSASAVSAVDADANARQLRDLLSVPCLRTELTMLSTLRSLLLGRLRRLQLFDPSSSARASAIVERGLDPASSSFRLHTADAAAFSVFRTEDERAREMNAASKAGSNYHVECALNYRIGQRDVLLAALERVDAMSAEAAIQVAAEIQKEQAAVTSSVAAAAVAAASSSSSSDRKSAPAAATDSVKSSSKRRKTGTVTSSDVDADSAESSSTPAATEWTALLPAYNDWLCKIGAHTNADWSNGVWSLQRECTVSSSSAAASSSSAAPAASPSSSSSSVLLAFPPSFLLSSTVMASSPSFAPCSALVAGLAEDQLAVLFLLHERSRGRKSPWSPWIVIVVALPPNPSSVPLPTPEQESDLDSLRAVLPAAEGSLLDLYSQLFPALSDAYPKLFKPVHHTFARFLWAARIVQERWVRFSGASSTGGPGESQEGVVPVPLMPASSAFAATVAEELPLAHEEEDESSTALVLRSMVPLAAGSLPTLCVSSAVDLVSRPRRSQASSNSALTIPFGSVLDLRRMLRSAQLDSTETGSLTTLPLRAWSASHQSLLARLGLEDESEEIVLRSGSGSDSGYSALLCAVVRSFFCSAVQLRDRAASCHSESAAVPSSSSSRGRVDDSDEESEEEDRQQQGTPSAAAQSSSANAAATSADAAAADAADAANDDGMEDDAEAEAQEDKEEAEEEAEEKEEEEEADPPQWLAADGSPMDEAALESSVQSFLGSLLRFSPAASASS